MESYHKHYTNPDKRKKMRDSRVRTHTKLQADFMAYLKEHPCIDCGETNLLVLEFDHLDPKQKSRNISEILRLGNKALLEKEIKKCVVRCANCHRKRTAYQNNSYRLKYL